MRFKVRQVSLLCIWQVVLPPSSDSSFFFLLISLNLRNILKIRERKGGRVGKEWYLLGDTVLNELLRTWFEGAKSKDSLYSFFSFFLWEKQGEIKLKRRSKSKRFPESYKTAKHKLRILVNMYASWEEFATGGIDRNANLKSIHFNGVCFR